MTVIRYRDLNQSDIVAIHNVSTEGFQPRNVADLCKGFHITPRTLNRAQELVYAQLLALHTDQPVPPAPRPNGAGHYVEVTSYDA